MPSETGQGVRIPKLSGGMRINPQQVTLPGSHPARRLGDFCVWSRPLMSRVTASMGDSRNRGEVLRGGEGGEASALGRTAGGSRKRLTGQIRVKAGLS